MSSTMLIFGLGYTATRLATRLADEGWVVIGTSRSGVPGTLRFDDVTAVQKMILSATHILSSAPPDTDGHDPVLATYGSMIAAAPAVWVGYLSSTGVYGDTGGAWVDESAPVGLGRRSARAAADLGWQALRADVRVFRLPGIYGPGRSALERVKSGRAQRINLPDQIFSRIHVDDIVAAICASMSRTPGIYNVTDDQPTDQNVVIEYACDLIGRPYPALVEPRDPSITPQSRLFYAENRRVSNKKIKRLLNWQPLYPNYKIGLTALLNHNAVTLPRTAGASDGSPSVGARIRTC